LELLCLSQISFLPLKQRGFGGDPTQRRQVLGAQPAGQHGQNVRVPVRAMVIMLRGHKLHGPLKTILQIQHGLFDDLAQMKIPLDVLRPRIRAYNQPIEHTPLPCLIDHFICLD
jgi:hypothetical protein